jgi:hypothetical protein
MVLGSGIRDPGSGKNLFRIPDPGSWGQKAPNPGSRIRIRNTEKHIIRYKADAKSSLKSALRHCHTNESDLVIQHSAVLYTVCRYRSIFCAN